MIERWLDHAFAVTAYGESPYLHECLQSLKNQDLSSRVIITTATPNRHIERLAAEFESPLFVNDNQPGIASDWNFAVKMADSPFVTIAHQDDVYCKGYLRHAYLMLTGAANPLIFFTNYGELRNGETVDENELLSMKRRLLKPLESGKHMDSVFIRRRILSFGSAICCPSVTLACNNIQIPVFNTGMRSNLDWEAWARVAKMKGSFLYDREILMYHRIHGGSETTAIIEDDGRSSEDYAMFCEFWPKPIARAINNIYTRSQSSNQVE